MPILWRTCMRETRLTMPELALIGGTRVALGAGLGLLLADRLEYPQRRAIGWTLLAIGALTTIPLAFEVLGRRSRLATFESRQTSWSGESMGDRMAGKHLRAEEVGAGI